MANRNNHKHDLTRINPMTIFGLSWINSREKNVLLLVGEFQPPWKKHITELVFP